jgi:hypothetical protein
MPKETDKIDGLIKRLDILIYILLRHGNIQEMTSREHIGLLTSLGLRDVEIANILGKTRGYVASERTKIRARGVNDEQK